MFAAEAWAAPLRKIGPPERNRRGSGFRLEFRKINPGHRWIQMMIEVPMMIEPDEIKKAPGPHVQSTLMDVANCSVVMQILEGGPDEAETAENDQIMENRNVEEVDQRTVPQENQPRFDLHLAKIFRVKSFLKRGGRAVEISFLCQPFRI